MVNSNQGSDGQVLLQVLSQNPNVQMECSESGTIRLKYGEEVILETNLQIPQLYKPVSPEKLSISTTPETPESKTNTQTTPESNPQPESTKTQSKNQSVSDIVLLPSNKPNAKIPTHILEEQMLNPNQALNPPKVFISYSWDSDEHKDRVLALANKLRIEDCIDCEIDQYEISPFQGWRLWMKNKIESADFVLLICTEKYLQRYNSEEEAGKGLGAIWETKIIIRHLYKAQMRNKKFIPVVFSSQDLDYIPNELDDFSHYVLDSNKGYESLCRHLTNQPEIIKPELSRNKKIYPPRKSKQNFF